MYLDGVRATLAEELDREPPSLAGHHAANIQEEELERRLEDGKRAENQMIQANLRLVVSIAKIREQVDELPGSHPGGVRGSHSGGGEV